MTSLAAATASPTTSAPARSLGILQIVRNLDTGGAQEVVRTLVAEMVAAGHRPVVCSMVEGPLAVDIRRLGVPVEIVTPKRHAVTAPHRYRREMARVRNEIAEVIDRHDIDVVQTHLLRSVDFEVAKLAGRDAPPLVYWTFHNSEFTLRAEHLHRHRWLLGPKRLAYRALYRTRARRVSGLVAVSEDVRHAINSGIGGLDDLVTVIPNGVDVRRYGPDEGQRGGVRAELGIDPAAQILIMVGTFKPQKGHAHAIDAAATLFAERDNVHLVLVGDGEGRAKIEWRARSARITDRVHFLGDRRDVPRLLSASDVFVLPSLWEGLPMALLEAMASGLACVASSVSGTRDVIEDEVSGLLVRPGDVDQLTSTLRDVMHDTDQARRLGANARQRVELEFSATGQAQRHVELFGADLSVCESS